MKGKVPNLLFSNKFGDIVEIIISNLNTLLFILKIFLFKLIFYF